jgi:uncharacterized membrane protein YadS
MNESKPWYQSKTLWANIVAAAATLATVLGVDIGLTPETQAELVAGIMVAVNIVLRFVTRTPIA